MAYRAKARRKRWAGMVAIVISACGLLTGCFGGGAPAAHFGGMEDYAAGEASEAKEAQWAANIGRDVQEATYEAGAVSEATGEAALDAYYKDAYGDQGGPP
jgi:hypothetical protein